MGLTPLKIFLAEQDPEQALIDICGGQTQIFQESQNFLNLFDAKLSQCDVILVPHDAKHWSDEYYKYLLGFSERKLILYFNRADRKRYISLNNSISIQITKSIRDREKVILAPCNVSSLEWLPFRKFTRSPVLSFVGYVPRLGPRRLFNSFVESPIHPIQCNSSIIRRRGIEEIKNSNLESIIEIRDHYGGAGSLIKEPYNFRKEFVDSIEHSDFVFCPRGDANGSQRIYEAVSAGRIPIIPSTNTKFPVIPSDDYSRMFLQIKTLSRNVENEVNYFWKDMNHSVYLSYQTLLRNLFSSFLDYQKYLMMLFQQTNVADIPRFCV